MKILFLCQYFPPEMGAPAARTFEHARHWVRCGHEVTVVCGLPNHPDGVIPEKYRGHLVYRETIEGVNVLRCWLYATPNRGVFKRSICFLSFMFSSMIVGSFFTPKCDVVVATSPQMLCALGGYIVARFKHRPYVVEVRDLWPKQIVDLGVVRNRLIIGALSWLERFMYRRAKGIVTVAEATRQEIISRGFPEEKLYTITNGIDEHFFRPMDRMVGIRQTVGWGNKTVVLYIGTHGLSQGLIHILETARQLQDHKGLRFVFVGTGAEREMLIEQARAMDLENVDFLTMQPKEKVPEFYAAADICLVPLKKREVFLYNIPSKMFEIMACGRPMVLGVEGQAKTLLDAAQSGVAVEPENPAAFAEAILALANNPEQRAVYGRNGRKHVLEHYTRSSRAEAYIACLEDVLKRCSSA